MLADKIRRIKEAKSKKMQKGRWQESKQSHYKNVTRIPSEQACELQKCIQLRRQENK